MQAILNRQPENYSSEQRTTAEKAKLRGVGKFTRPTLSADALRYYENVVKTDAWQKKKRAFFANAEEFLQSVVPKGKKVMLIGCLDAQIIEKLNPSVGVALDVSEAVARLARARSTNRNITYFSGKPEDFSTPEKFDYVILLNMVDHSPDIFALVESLTRFTHEDSRVIVSMINPLWHPLVRLASFLKIRIPDFKRNLVAGDALCDALEIKQFKVMDICKRVLIPKQIPFLSTLFNRYVARLPLINSLCFVQYISAKPRGAKRPPRASCSVIIPCYNEEGNIAECISRVPQMGSFTEVVVVNDGSKDGTARVVDSLKESNPNLTFVNYAKNRGKGNAVLEGIRASKGDIVMILDADMTVPPEELTDFYEALESNTADFASGTRFLYPMEREAMRLANYLGNILFSKLVQVIVGSKCSDTLCGTKAMWKRDFADFRLEDAAWGDFDLIFHAAKRKLKSVQVPVHYKSRVAGESKMKAFSSGIAFFKLCLRKWVQLP